MSAEQHPGAVQEAMDQPEAGDDGLATEITNAVQPWACRNDKPPFSAEELVVMALAWTQAPMTELCIAQWITDRFPYYVQLACREIFESVCLDYLFGYPSSRSKSGLFFALTRSHETNTDGNIGHRGDPTYTAKLKCRPLTEILALLQVNKQIYQEALPVFYSVNTFICYSIHELDKLLKCASESRRKHIGHIIFNYSPSDTQPASSAFRLLKTVEHLRKLDITVDESAWLDVKNRKGEPAYPDLEKLPGLATLRIIRGLKTVTFHGDCEKLRAYLVPEMTKPKSKKKASTGAKKRTVDGDSERVDTKSTLRGVTRKKQG
ncbi:hypothetical protein LTR36_004998 [Oleoguttula mirabilis]|uniref:DUF7730 domain-containing protein n=1 Tax=Oleoguttula mirabilis TaxID=1507867 RepID=A0AAV9JW06_9PEZI|nr:hypothetical protein LTR36_004998 [Oleoguttula mirabilis]